MKRTFTDHAIWAIDRRERMDVLIRAYKEDGLPLDEVRALLPPVWSYSDEVDDSAAVWLPLWKDICRGQSIGDVDELPPDEWLTIYRGVGNGEPPDGIAWSLDRRVAMLFAQRWPWHKQPMVYTGRVQRRHVMAYTNVRLEQEVIVDPSVVEDITVEDAPATMDEWRVPTADVVEWLAEYEVPTTKAFRDAAARDLVDIVGHATRLLARCREDDEREGQGG